MKKIFIFLIVLLVGVVTFGYLSYRSNYVGESYYLQVTRDGNKEKILDDSGKPFYLYQYKEQVFNKNGKEKQVDFIASHNLRHKAYLKLIYSARKGVTYWEEVTNKDIPNKALQNIKKYCY